MAAAAAAARPPCGGDDIEVGKTDGLTDGPMFMPRPDVEAPAAARWLEEEEEEEEGCPVSDDC